MTIRKAVLSDLDNIKSIFVEAKKKMVSDGNLTQWKDIDYPFCYTKEDIKKGQCYVIEDNNELVATFVFIIGEDPTYSYIEGNWPNNNKYGVIHRIASNGKMKNVFRAALDYASTYNVDLRIDTHKDNKRMIHLIESYGFKYCGIIYVNDGTPRLAYQKERE